MTAALTDGLQGAAQLLADNEMMVLSGAGLSTESGIPDYRGPTGSARRANPMTYEEFTGNDGARQRYWARSHIGWRRIAGATPNAGHLAVAELERQGRLSGIVTQNVDGLHQSAGAHSVIELHGNLATVRCLACGERTPRQSLHERLAAANPDWEGGAAASAPDGDAAVADTAIANFALVDCASCGGMLKPDVVFFGEAVPKERVQRCFDLLEASRTLLVVGSSLTVMSGYRFVLRAEKLGIPVVICNQGATRGDHLATLRIDAPLGELLPQLVEALAHQAMVPPPR